MIAIARSGFLLAIKSRLNAKAFTLDPIAELVIAVGLSDFIVIRDSSVITSIIHRSSSNSDKIGV